MKLVSAEPFGVLMTAKDGETHGLYFEEDFQLTDFYIPWNKTFVLETQPSYKTFVKSFDTSPFHLQGAVRTVLDPVRQQQ